MSPLRSHDVSFRANQATPLAQNTQPSTPANVSLMAAATPTPTPMPAQLPPLPLGAVPAAKARRGRALTAKQVEALRRFCVVIARALAFASELVRPYDASRAEQCLRYAERIGELGGHAHFERCDLLAFVEATHAAQEALVTLRDGFSPTGTRERRRLRKQMGGTDVPSLAEGVRKQMRKKERWLTTLLRKTGDALQTGDLLPQQVASTPPRFA